MHVTNFVTHVEENMTGRSLGLILRMDQKGQWPASMKLTVYSKLGPHTTTNSAYDTPIGDKKNVRPYMHLNLEIA